MEKLYNGKYKKVRKIGEGSFGAVYLVQEGSQYYSMKKFFLDNISKGGAVKQYDLLSKFSHENIHQVKEMFFHKKNQYLISNYYANNLSEFITNPKMKEKIIKGVIFQLIKGVNYLHSMNFLHRDIKPDNILISSEGTIKLTDFDLCRKISEGGEKLSKTAVTLYYRAPEILFGDSFYSKPVDIWSIGCVFCELVIGKVLFKGSNEISTLNKISEMLGAPSDKNWPGVEGLPYYLKFENDKGILENVLVEKGLSKEGVEFAKKLLSLDPKKRPTCEEILEDDYFKNKNDVASPEEIKKALDLK